MKHLEYTHDQFIDRFFDPNWGPWTTEETKVELKKLFKESMDFAKLMMDDRDNLLKEVASLKKQLYGSLGQ